MRDQSGACTHDLRGYSHGDRVGREVFGDDGSRTNDAAVADGHTGRDDDASAEPDVIADDDVAISLGLLAEGFAFLELIVGSRDKDFGGKRNKIAEHDASGFGPRPEVASLPDVTALAHGDALAVSEGNVGGHACAAPDGDAPALPDVRVVEVVNQPEKMGVAAGIDQRA